MPEISSLANSSLGITLLVAKLLCFVKRCYLKIFIDSTKK